MRSPFYISALTLIVTGGCFGQSVDPLSPSDTTLPMETRRWIAAAQDGVVVARARRDAALEKLRQMVLRQEYIDDEIDFGERGEDLNKTIRELAEARVVLAELGRKLAEAVLILAEAKYQLANAERAVLHDLAIYELEPIRNEVQKARDQLGKARKEQQDQREVVENLVTRWWQVYSAYVASNGDTRPFWIGSSTLLNVSKKAPQQKKAESLDSIQPRTETKVLEIPSEEQIEQRSDKPDKRESSSPESAKQVPTNPFK